MGPEERSSLARVIHELPDGSMPCALNTTTLRGVRSSLVLKETGDVGKARAVRNLDVAPHLVFTDFRRHGYATVRASPRELATEFVCIPRPLERSDAADGGPIVYRQSISSSSGALVKDPSCDRRSSRATRGSRFRD